MAICKIAHELVLDHEPAITTIHTPDMPTLFSSSILGYRFARTGVIFLMWSILDGVIDELDYVRLVITEWIDALDDDITLSLPRNMHKQHLHDASIVLQDFLNVVKPLLSDMRAFENVNSPLSVFCGENAEVFKKSYDELERIFADIEALMAKRKSLEEYFGSSQAERLTKVLYVSTIVWVFTVFCGPISPCSLTLPHTHTHGLFFSFAQVHIDTGDNNVRPGTIFDWTVWDELCRHARAGVGAWLPVVLDPLYRTGVWDSCHVLEV